MGKFRTLPPSFLHIQIPLVPPGLPRVLPPLRVQPLRHQTGELRWGENKKRGRPGLNSFSQMETNAFCRKKLFSSSEKKTFSFCADQVTGGVAAVVETTNVVLNFLQINNLREGNSNKLRAILAKKPVVFTVANHLGLRRTLLSRGHSCFSRS